MLSGLPVSTITKARGPSAAVAGGPIVQGNRHTLRELTQLVTTLDGFRLLLGCHGSPATRALSIKALPIRERADALEALGGRLMTLPKTEREEANALFVELASQVPELGPVLCFLFVDAPGVVTLADFRAALRKIQGLPEALWSEAMAALGARLLALPETQMWQAIPPFLEFDRQVTQRRLGLHDQLVLAASSEPMRLVQREAELVATGGLAHTAAAMPGENVRLVAQYFGIVQPESIQQLERVAIASAVTAAVHNSESLRVSARRSGIEISADNMTRMTNEAVSPGGAAWNAVYNGRDAQALARSLGIDHDPEAVARLLEAALYAGGLGGY